MADQREKHHFGASSAPESSADLLAAISLFEKDHPKECQKAQTEFWIRHYDPLVAYIAGEHRHDLTDGTGPDDLAAETFLKAFANADSFKEKGDQEQREKKAQAWLRRIADRLVSDMGRNGGRFIRNLNGDDTIITDHAVNLETPVDGETEPEKASPVLEELLRILEELPEDQRRVLELGSEYYDADKINQRLPNGVAQTIADALQTTVPNVRKRRSRALKTIKDKLTAKGLNLE